MQNKFHVWYDIFSMKLFWIIKPWKRKAYERTTAVTQNFGKTIWIYFRVVKSNCFWRTLATALRGRRNRSAAWRSSNLLLRPATSRPLCFDTDEKTNIYAFLEKTLGVSKKNTRQKVLFAEAWVPSVAPKFALWKSFYFKTFKPSRARFENCCVIFSFWSEPSAFPAST